MGVFDVRRILGVHYEEWVRILQARIARNEGDAEWLKAVRDALIAEGEAELVAVAKAKAEESI